MEIVQDCVEKSYNNDKRWKLSRIVRVKPKTLVILEDFTFFEYVITLFPFFSCFSFFSFLIIFDIFHTFFFLSICSGFLFLPF